MAYNKFAPAEAKTCLISIASYCERALAGEIHNPLLGRRRQFKNLMQLLLEMDSMCDENESIHDPGDIRGRDGLENPETENKANRPIATFKVDLLFRQNESWQGNILWVEKKQEAQFRSALEMIMLMDGALNTA